MVKSKSNNENKGKVKKIAILFLALLLFGTIGYIIILRISLLDALYMTVITISTVGFKEVAAMNPKPKIFSIFLIFMGVGTVGYTFSTLVLMLVEGQFNEFWMDRMNDRKVSELDNHYIICGAGKTGEIIIEQFSKEKLPFVVIDNNEERYNYWLNKNVLIVHGNATDSEILEKVNIGKAKGLISCLPNDVDNIVTVLTSRNLNKDLYIISQALESDSLRNLCRLVPTRPFR